MDINEIAENLKEKGLFIRLTDDGIRGALTAEKWEGMYILQNAFDLKIVNDIVKVTYPYFQTGDETKDFTDFDSLCKFLLEDLVHVHDRPRR